MYQYVHICLYINVDRYMYIHVFEYDIYICIYCIYIKDFICIRIYINMFINMYGFENKSIFEMYLYIFFYSKSDRYNIHAFLFIFT